jgi:hypothetical protein
MSLLPPEYYVVGVQAALLHHLRGELSLTETLIGRLGKPHTFLQRDPEADTFLRPWTHKLSL